MTVAVGTELGAGAGVVPGSSSGAGAEVGAGAGFRSRALGKAVAFVASANTALATTEFADGAPEKTTLCTAAKGSGLAWKFSGTNNGPATAGKESFKANLQSMLRSWGVPNESASGTEIAAEGEAGTIRTSGDGKNAENRVSQRPNGDSVPWHGAGNTAAVAAGEADDFPRYTSRTSLTQSARVAANVPPSAPTRAATSGTEVDPDGGHSASHRTTGKKVGNTGDGSTPPPSTPAAPGTLPLLNSTMAAQELTADATAPITASNASAHLNQLIMNPANRTTDQSVDLDPLINTDFQTKRAVVSTHQSARAITATHETNLTAPAHTARPSISSASQSVTQSTGAAAAADSTEDGTPNQKEFVARPLLKSPAISGDASNATDISPSDAGAVLDGRKAAAGEKGTYGGEGAGHRAGTKETPIAPFTSATREGSPDANPVNGQGSTTQTVHAAGPETEKAAILTQNVAHLSSQISEASGSVIVRDAAGAHSMAGGLNAASSASEEMRWAARPEPFAALDAGTVSAPNWIHAGGREAEAGFEDPALGWVGVRADMSNGGIHAAVVPSSTEAAQELSGHLAGLSTYLEESRTPVATLTMEVPGHGGSEAAMNPGAGQSGDQGSHQGMNGDMQQSTSQGSETAASAPETRTTVSPASDAGPDGGIVTYPRDGSGTHISVMA